MVEPSRRGTLIVKSGRCVTMGLPFGKQSNCRHAMSNDHQRSTNGPAEADDVRARASWVQRPKSALKLTREGSTSRRSARMLTRTVTGSAKKRNREETVVVTLTGVAATAGAT